MNQTEKTNWRPVILFYLIACAIAWPFFWWRDMHPESWAQWQFLGVQIHSCHINPSMYIHTSE